jgi:peptidoglycan/LPS O-acetylase OafA/YrhL
MAVVFAHIGISDSSSGTYAVICFFVLSGFLITHLLLREHDERGDISLRKFYVRRALRIFPAFYGYGLVYIVGRIVLKLPTNWPAVISCLTYTSNYFNSLSNQLPTTMGHTWSLAVEEQLYLVWPFLFWKLAGNKAGFMKGLVVAILAVWSYRWVSVRFDVLGNYVFDAFENRADDLAIRCLLAIANHQKRIPRWLIDGKWIGLMALVLIGTSTVVRLNGPRYAWSLVAVGFGVLLVQSIAPSQSLGYKWLNSRPLYALGVVSYSLYLYHEFANRLPSSLRTAPVEIAFAIALATASYFLVKKPFLKWKDRVSRSSRLAVP